MLVLNKPRPPGQTGRRPGLASSAAEALVQVWIDDAIDLLVRMEHTCSLDVVDERGAISDGEQAELVGCTREAISQRVARYKVRLRIGLIEQGIDEELLNEL